MTDQEILIKSRVRGCLVGFYVGVHFGRRYENLSSHQVQQLMDSDYDSKSRIVPIKVDGDNSVGLVDVLTNSILRDKNFLPENISSDYVKWYRASGLRPDSTTLRALEVVPGNYPTLSQALTYNAFTRNKDSLDSGSLFRTIPLGILGSTIDESVLMRWTDTDCRFTHSNSLVVDAFKTLSNCFRTAIITGDRREIFNTAKRTCQTKPVKKMLVSVEENSHHPLYFQSEGSDFDCIDPDGDRRHYFGIPLHLSLIELSYSQCFLRSMERTCMRGGDTTTNCGIMGAMLGAVLGVSSIPVEWKRDILNIHPTLLNIADGLIEEETDSYD